jgi:hypothetical protein
LLYSGSWLFFLCLCGAVFLSAAGEYQDASPVPQNLDTDNQLVNFCMAEEASGFDQTRVRFWAEGGAGG